MITTNTQLAESAVQRLSCTIQKLIHIPDLHQAFLDGQSSPIPQTT